MNEHEKKGGWMSTEHGPPIPEDVPPFLKEFLTGNRKAKPKEPKPIPEPNIYEIEWSDGTVETVLAHGMGIQGQPGNAFQIMVFGKVPDGATDPDGGLEPIRIIPLYFQAEKMVTQVHKVESEGLFKDEDIPRP